MTDTADVFVRGSAPAVVPRPFGLFSVASPESAADPHWMFGLEWESTGCIPVYVTEDGCLTGSTPADKTVTGCSVDWAQFKPFSVYTYVKRTGEDRNDIDAWATTVLAQGEQFGVETRLWADLTAAVPAPVAGTNVLGALAKVEQALAAGYRGTGVIHISPDDATRLGDVLVASGSRLTTRIGTPVVVGSGYTPGKIFGTGALAVRREAAVSYPSNVPSTNDLFVLAERTYLVGWDCLVVAATTGP